MNNIFWLTTNVRDDLNEILGNDHELRMSESRILITQLRHSLYCLADFCKSSPEEDLIFQLIYEIQEFPFMVGAQCKIRIKL